MQRKLIRRIVGIKVKGEMVSVSRESKVYENGKHYYINDGETETKFKKEWVTELHKANAFNGGVQIIPIASG